MKYQLSVIVPFLDEEKYLEESFNRLLEIKLFNKIILVNDGSSDGSSKIAQDLAGKYKFVEIISL